jgi:hypothetical protein
VNQEKAIEVLLNPIKFDLDASPYFKEEYKRREDINNRIILPRNIIVKPLTTTETSAFGDNIFSLVQTESNAMKKTENSVKLRHSNKKEYDEAKELYNRARERITATFNIDHWNFFGKIVADSSAQYSDDFTSQKKEEAKTDPSILIIERTIWDAQPPDKINPNQPKFLVEVGDNHRLSRIINSIEDALDPESVIEVPEQFRKQFEADIEQSLMNYAGITTAVVGSFLPYKKAITQAQEDYLAFSDKETLFLKEEVSSDEMLGEPGEPIDWESLINYEYLKKNCPDPSTVFAMHFDLSASGDATGFSIGHIMAYTSVDRSSQLEEDQGNRDTSNIIVPVYMIDGVLRITSLKGASLGSGDIDPRFVTLLGLELKKQLNICYGSADTHGSSRAVLIDWQKQTSNLEHRISIKFISVDRDLLPYMEVKQSLRENRLMFQPHSILDQELREIRKEVKNGRPWINHPSNGSKDVADSMAGVIYVLKEYESQRNIILSNTTQQSHRRHRPVASSSSRRDAYGQRTTRRHSSAINASRKRAS